jgi:hypothetical protein
MPKTISSKTGNAPIVKVGHTASNQFGSNPDVKTKGRSASRELSGK